jgi:hypothetical protein
LSKISDKLWERTYEKSEETNFAETHWPVYEAEAYQLCGMEGDRYIEVPRANARAGRVKSVDPLAPEYASLFLKFARWFDAQKMEKVKPGCFDIPTLDTERNAQAALAWAREYGVLGLGTNPNESFAVGGGIFSSSAQIAANRLGVPHLGHSGTRAYKKSPTGSKHETVEMFVLEAYEANVVLKLYEAATASTVDPSSIARVMPSKRDFAAYAAHLPEAYRRSANTEREYWSQDADLARNWALAVVEETVIRKVESDVYPILLGKPDSYRPGWGFKSLLGAMWLQMRNFMLGENNRCDWCGKLFYKSRRDKRYCNALCAGRARAHRNYYAEDGRLSSKQVRKAKRYRQQG